MDAHENEYLAAIAGLHEQTVSPAPQCTYAIGDFVSGVSAGKRWSGRIWNVEGDRLSIVMAGGWGAVSSPDVPQNPKKPRGFWFGDCPPPPPH
jgi:hypothetical protein